MDKDWIKAVTLLCVIAENNADSMRRTVRYIEIMKREYGLDGESFRQVYDEWFRTGEVSEKYRQRDWSSKRRTGLPLYHRGVDGMCRMLEEGVIEEDMFLKSSGKPHMKYCKKREKLILDFTGLFLDALENLAQKKN